MQPNTFRQLLRWNHRALSRGQSHKIGAISQFIDKWALWGFVWISFMIEFVAITSFPNFSDDGYGTPEEDDQLPAGQQFVSEGQRPGTGCSKKCLRPERAIFDRR
jgi:hypothetical protein